MSIGPSRWVGASFRRCSFLVDDTLQMFCRNPKTLFVRRQNEAGASPNDPGPSLDLRQQRLEGCRVSRADLQQMAGLSGDRMAFHDLVTGTDMLEKSGVMCRGVDPNHDVSGYIEGQRSGGELGGESKDHAPLLELPQALSDCRRGKSYQLGQGPELDAAIALEDFENLDVDTIEIGR